MAEIIKFHKPTIEEKFCDSLTEQQLEWYFEILSKIDDEFLKLVRENEKLETTLAKKCLEVEKLKKIRKEK